MARTQSQLPSDREGGGIRIYALGHFRVLAGTSQVHLQSKAAKPLQLLKVLIALGSDSVAVEPLTESLWPDADGDRAYGAFTITLRRLRELIGHEGAILRAGRLSLNSDVCWTDAVEYVRSISEASRLLASGGEHQASEHLREALELYKGPFLPGEYEPAEILSARSQWHGMLLRNIDSFGTHYQRQNQTDQAIALYQRGLEIDDQAEVLYQRLLRIYLAQDRLADGIALYQRCREILQAAFGTVPSEDTEELHRDLLRAQRQRPGGSQPSPPTFAPHSGVTGGSGAESRTEPTPTAQPPSALLGERRTATVLNIRFAFPNGGRIEVDPEELQTGLRDLQKEAALQVAQQRGEVIPAAGGSVTASFGLQGSHDDDARRAVLTALSLRERLASNRSAGEERPKAAFCAGIATGEVIVSDSGLQAPASSIVGASIARSADLAANARNGQILVDPQTWQLVHDYFAGTALPGSGANASLGLESIEILHPFGAGTRFEAAIQRGLSLFAGREWELDTLQDCLSLAAVGQGQLVSIRGDSGIGKSRLVYEFLQSIDKSRSTALEGRCHALGMETPYLPFLQVLQKGLLLEDWIDEPNLHDVAVANISGVGPEMERYLPHLLHLLSIPSDRYRLSETLQGAARRHELEDALTAFVTLSASHQPLILVFEDWHWADEASDAALYALLSRIGQSPVMVVVVHRPEYTPRWSTFEHHRPLLLRPLDGLQTGRIVRSVLRRESLPEGLEEEIHARTQGNALFIEEITRTLMDQGTALPLRENATIGRKAGRLALPATVRAVIRSRIDQLDPPDREILRLASAIGPSFELDILRRIAPSAEDVAGALQRLAQEDLIRPLRLSTPGHYEFKHGLTQEVAYDSLLVSQRRDLHGVIGTAIEALHAGSLEQHCEELATHYAQSEDTDKAMRFLEMAGDKAVRQHAIAAARAHYRRAVALAGLGAAQVAFALRAIDLSHKLASVSEYAPSMELLDTLNVARVRAAELGDERRLMQTIYWMGRLHYILGELPEALSMFEKSLRLAEHNKEHALYARCLSAMGRTCVYTAEHERGIGYLARSIAILGELGDQEELAYSSHVLGLHYGMIGEFDKAFEQAARGLKIAKDLKMVSRQPMAQNQLAWLQGLRGEFAPGLETIEGARAITQKAGDFYSLGVASVVEGWLRFMSGEQVAGIRLMTQGIERIKGIGSNMALTQWHGLLAEMLALVGDVEEARVHAEDAIALAKGGQRHGESVAHRALGIAAAYRGGEDHAAVDRHMETSIEIAGRLHERPFAAVSHLRFSGILLARGDSLEAEKHSGKARTQFERMGMTGWLSLLPC